MIAISAPLAAQSFSHPTLHPSQAAPFSQPQTAAGKRKTVRAAAAEFRSNRFGKFSGTSDLHTCSRQLSPRSPNSSLRHCRCFTRRQRRGNLPTASPAEWARCLFDCAFHFYRQYIAGRRFPTDTAGCARRVSNNSRPVRDGKVRCTRAPPHDTNAMNDPTF